MTIKSELRRKMKGFKGPNLCVHFWRCDNLRRWRGLWRRVGRRGGVFIVAGIVAGTEK